MSCFSQFINPEQEFIDFSVDWDGGTLQKNGELQTIDDLVLCKNCVEQAAYVLGMEYPHELEAKNKELDTEVRSLRAKIAFLKKDLEK